jgi:ribonuclease Y
LTDNSIMILIIFGSVVFGFLFGFALRERLFKNRLTAAENLSARIVDEAKKEAETIKKEAVIQAKENVLKIKSEFDKESRDRKLELDNLEKKIRSKEENLDKRIDQLTQKEASGEIREKSLVSREAAFSKKQENLDRMVEEQRQKLEKIAGISSEEAKNYLMQDMESEARRDVAVMIRKIEEEAKRTADNKSREIIAYAIQRYAGDFVGENTVSVVNLPGDEMKGRIIGREGRNIRAIEAATGIDLIVDDTPEAVVLSGFDPIRREGPKFHWKD